MRTNFTVGKPICSKVSFSKQAYIPKRYSHHSLFPFLVCETDGTYISKLFVPGVLDIVNNIKGITEQFSELVDAAFTEFKYDFSHNKDCLV